jgi:ADP-ribose pyrophosphatase YjhB (NUDIX family)
MTSVAPTLFFEDESVIEERIKSFRNQGFDRINIPGGTSKDGSHYSGAVIPAYDPERKKMYFVGLPYNSLFHKEGDENGHTKKAGEKPLETLIREVIEETGLTIFPEYIETLDASYNIPDKRDPEPDPKKKKRHYKYFYFAPKFAGSLFAFEGANPIDGETAAPLLIPAHLFVKVVFPGHLAAVREVIEKLKGISPEYYYALANL